MAKKGGYTLGEYQGGYSSLDPNKAYGNAGFTGYRSKTSSIGASTSPQTANQIQQVNQLLNQGIVPIEIGTIEPGVFDKIPKKHFKEMNRMAKLTGSKLSVHAPVQIEPSGIGKEGWSETQRELAERQLSSVVEKSAQVSDKERVPITIHPTGGLPGSEWIPKKGGKEGEREKEKVVAVDRESGKMVPVEKEEKFYPGSKEVSESKSPGEGRIYSPEEKLNYHNDVQWEEELDQLLYRKDRVDEMLRRQPPQVQDTGRALEKYPKEERNKEFEKNPEVKKSYMDYKNVKTYLDDMQRKLKDDFDKAWRYAASENDKKQLQELSKEYSQKIQKLNEDPANLEAQSEAVQDLLQGLKDISPPKQLVPIEDYAVGESSKTFSNVALDAYKKYGKKAPQINIENWTTGTAFSGSMDDMNRLIKKSKENFAKKAQKPKDEGGSGLSESQAKKAADDMIGMTLDLGHLNVAKSKGFSDKYLTEEAKKVADQVKHVHLADNFGYSDSHLPPGMGNVPNKEMLKELEKQGRTKEMRKIVEAGDFTQQFGASPYPYSLEGMGAPFYGEGEPYWNQAAGFQQGYSGGFGQMLPPGHFETYGTPSFSNLPTDLGGQRMGAGGSRMSGRQME